MIIGMQGKAMSGKDTFGQMLAESLYDKTGDVYILIAFAKNLKEKVQKDFDLSYDQLWGDQKEVEDKRYKRWYQDRDDFKYWTPREILQEYGVFFRTISSGFWANSLFNLIEEKEYENVIITDVRFPNEVEGVVKRDGVNIKILREVAGSKINAEHISEHALGEYKHLIDFYINNNGSLEDLKNVANDTAMAISAMNKTKEIMTDG